MAAEAGLLTEDEAAERLRVCARTLRKERQAGRLPYVLIGRAVRYTLGDLESFIERARHQEPPARRQPTQGRKVRGNTGNVVSIRRYSDRGR